MAADDRSEKNVHTLPVGQPRPKLDPRLEEIRNILQASDPVDAPPDSIEALINDGYLFQKRFGPGFNWERQHRAALFRLIDAKGVTDKEVRLFRHTGNLRRTRRSVELSATGLVALLGAFQLGIWGGITLALTIALGLDFISMSRLPFKVLAAVGVLSGVCYFLYVSSITPWTTQRRIERRVQTSPSA